MKGKKVLKILAVTLVVLVGIGFALFRVANYIYDNAEIQQGEWGPYEVVKIQSIGPITEDGTEFTPVVGFGYNLAREQPLIKVKQTTAHPPVSIRVSTDDRDTVTYFAIRRAPLYKELPWGRAPVSVAEDYIVYFPGEPDFYIGEPLTK